MQADNLVFQLILNIGLLALVANLLSKLRIIQNIILQERRSVKSQALLSLVFAGIIILSTYTSIDIGGYSLNTRVIGAMAAGVLGGPIIGLYASFLSAIYVYFFSQPQMFAMASAFSTVLFGLLGGGFYPYFQRGKWKYRDLFLLTCFAEICDMIALLRLSSPFETALNTVLEIAAPMILLNSIGILIFISSFNNVFILQDIESSRQLQQASELSRKCLPLLSHGFHEGEDMHELASVILRETDWMGVMLTDRTKILEWQQKGIEYQPEDLTRIPRVGKDAMRAGELMTMYHVPKSSSWYEWMKEYSMVAAPFMLKEQAVGCLIVWMKKTWVFRTSELELLQHVVTLGSYQIAMAELEHQKAMWQQAELKALQFQINPHFLFNALNTISSVCREDSERARELLVILANYFRYNLDGTTGMVPMEEEIRHVRDYLALEKGRFEEKLEVTYELPPQMDILIPTLILQPVVENAVKYGINHEGRRIVKIKVEENKEKFVVSISDKGKGFPPNVIQALESGESMGKSVGLNNVYKRMKSIYGDDCRPRIISSDKGSCVQLTFKKGC